MLIETCDGHKLSVDKDILSLCKGVGAWFQEDAQSLDDDETAFPLQHVSLRGLEIVLKYLGKYHEVKQPLPPPVTCRFEDIASSDKDFVDVDLVLLIEVLKAAHFLDVPTLCCLAASKLFSLVEITKPSDWYAQIDKLMEHCKQKQPWKPVSLPQRRHDYKNFTCISHINLTHPGERERQYVDGETTEEQEKLPSPVWFILPEHALMVAYAIERLGCMCDVEFRPDLLYEPSLIERVICFALAPGKIAEYLPNSPYDKDYWKIHKGHELVSDIISWMIKTCAIPEQGNFGVKCSERAWQDPSAMVDYGLEHFLKNRPHSVARHVTCWLLEMFLQFNLSITIYDMLSIASVISGETTVFQTLCDRYKQVCDIGIENSGNDQTTFASARMRSMLRFHVHFLSCSPIENKVLFFNAAFYKRYDIMEEYYKNIHFRNLGPKTFEGQFHHLSYEYLESLLKREIISAADCLRDLVKVDKLDHVKMVMSYTRREKVREMEMVWTAFSSAALECADYFLTEFNLPLDQAMAFQATRATDDRVIEVMEFFVLKGGVIGRSVLKKKIASENFDIIKFIVDPSKNMNQKKDLISEEDAMVAACGKCAYKQIKKLQKALKCLVTEECVQVAKKRRKTPEQEKVLKYLKSCLKAQNADDIDDDEYSEEEEEKQPPKKKRKSK
jgi:hypothetical protein